MNKRKINILFLLLFTITSTAVAKDKIDAVKGFYFLDWGISFETLKKLLVSSKIDFQDNSEWITQDIIFQYKGLETSCYQGDVDGKYVFNHVSQLRFYDGELKKAEKKFNSILKEFKTKFGKPDTNENDKEQQEVIWNGKYTRIILSLFKVDTIAIRIDWEMNSRNDFELGDQLSDYTFLTGTWINMNSDFHGNLTINANGTYQWESPDWFWENHSNGKIMVYQNGLKFISKKSQEFIFEYEYDESGLMKFSMKNTDDNNAIWYWFAD